MILKEYRKHFVEKLQLIYPNEEINAFFYLLAESVLGLKKVEVSMQLQRPLTTEETKLLDSALSALQKEKPIQYIIGETYFYGLPIKVDSSTLIPRPETEELVDWIIKENSYASPEIIDIGTGTGCIAISLAKHIKNANLTAIDISEGALKIAKKNARLNNSSVEFIQTDILQVSRLPKFYDVIVSNPPYIRNSEKQYIQKNVLSYEPHSALFVSDIDPLLFYNKIADIALKNLNTNGMLFFEINEAFGEKLVTLLMNKGFKNICLKKDVFGKDRMIKSTI
ncbi:peptide chain release factor N(5)-glutamine methyltransferase [uncultured Planktosalinus sp.]|uniref:peptide chain release factor N(5)-glutamine methyltransferase n=1 Tax=uncultured Planktosalinus sp. TaxID=1810935 RepID=UPI0030D6F47A